VIAYFIRTLRPGSRSVSLIYHEQELITFPPIVIPPNVRQALMVSRPDDIALPESKPNPNDPYTHTNNLGNGGPPHGNGFNNLKLRVPMERRCVCPIRFSYFFFCSDVVKQDTLRVPTTFNGRPRSRITINVSQRFSSTSRAGTTPPLPLSPRVSSSGSGVRTLGISGWTCRHGWTASISLV